MIRGEARKIRVGRSLYNSKLGSSWLHFVCPFSYHFGDRDSMLVHEEKLKDRVVDIILDESFISQAFFFFFFGLLPLQQ